MSPFKTTTAETNHELKLTKNIRTHTIVQSLPRPLHFNHVHGFPPKMCNFLNSILLLFYVILSNFFLPARSVHFASISNVGLSNQGTSANTIENSSANPRSITKSSPPTTLHSLPVACPRHWSLFHSAFECELKRSTLRKSSSTC